MKNILRESIIELELEEGLRKQLNISFLNEEQSIFPNAKEMVNKLTNYCSNYIADTSNATDSNDNFYIFNISLPEKFFGKNTFFQKIYCKIVVYLLKDSSYKLTNNEKEFFRTNLKNNYDPWFYAIENDKLEVVVINLGCVVRDREDLRVELSREFMHEMTHAYENWRRILKSGEYYGLLDYSNKTQYGSKHSLMLNQDKKLSNEENDLINDIFYVLYFISKPEINAKLSEFYGEIKNRKLDNIEQASSIIYSTNTWKEIKSVYEIIKDLVFYFDFDEKKIVDAINKVSKKKYRNYNALINELKHKFSFIKNDLFKKMAKIVYRVKMEQEADNK